MNMFSVEWDICIIEMGFDEILILIIGIICYVLIYCIIVFFKVLIIVLIGDFMIIYM